MELFEILFIALFILFPILDQVLRRRGGPGPDEPGSHADPTSEMGEEWAEGERSSAPPSREPVQASDMVPDDLWAVLTGETRRTEGAGTATEGEGEGTGPGSFPGTGTTPARTEPGARDLPEWEEAWTPRAEPRWRLEEGAEAPAPPSREYIGPEAYSLEELDFEPIERRLPSPEARHREFHERIERPRPRKRSRRSAVGRALSSPGSLRRAFVVSEVLGPPKSLEGERRNG